MWSAGTAATHAALIDPDGLVVAEDEHGAPNGNGFRIVRTLSPGAYDLQVTASRGGQFILHAGLAGDLPVADEALFACFNTNHVDGDHLESLVELYCLGEGIASLSGLEQASKLEVLELGNNAIQDLSPLANLTGLRVLGLAGNAVSDLAPLSGLPRLLVLNLAGNPVDAEALYALNSLAGRLRELDFRGIPSLSEGQLAKVRKKLPHTLLIAPDGTTIP